MNQTQRIAELQNALAVAIEALEEFYGSDESSNLDYLLEILNKGAA